MNDTNEEVIVEQVDDSASPEYISDYISGIKVKATTK